MDQLPTLDAHCHLSQEHTEEDLTETGFAVALTLSHEEAGRAVCRKEEHIAWGVGCYPRRAASQETFNLDTFRRLAEHTAVVGEIGLDTGSRVPIDVQTQIFRRILEYVASQPRIVSIHSYRATGLVLEELRRTPITSPILHWWTGSAAETSDAVDLGCYFSVHSAVARHSKFRTRVPPERFLVESDHGYGDPPAAIPCRVEWVEHLIAQQLQITFKDARRLVWRNFLTIVRNTGTIQLLPDLFREILLDISELEGGKNG